MHVTAVVVALARTDVPVTPDRDTARRWLAEELARPEYATEPSLLERLLTWFLHLFDGAPSIDLPPWYTLAVTAAVAALVVLVARWVTGPVRLRRSTGRSSVVTADDDTRTAAQLRAAADAAAARGDWPTAVAERFRAIVRALEDRTVLDIRPGRTAQEAAADAGARLAEQTGALTRAATTFDGVVYGHHTAGPSDDAALRSLDAQLARARVPVTVAAGAVTGRRPAHPDAVPEDPS